MRVTNKSRPIEVLPKLIAEHEPLTYAEIGLLEGLSTRRVEAIADQALLKLRYILNKRDVL